MPTQMNKAPCITPKGVYLVSTLKKILTGRDACALQGVGYSELAEHKMLDVPDALLHDCAGNAFSLQVTIFAMLAVLRDQ